MEATIYKPLISCVLITGVSLIVYYFHIYYWFFDLDNFFILHFASTGTGSVPFIAGEQIGEFSQYNSNIYLLILGMLLDIFSGKKFVFDLCSLTIFWGFVYVLFRAFNGFLNDRSKNIIFIIFLIALFLSYSPYGHWFFIELAAPSKLAGVLFITTLIVFFAPTVKAKAVFLVFLTLITCNTHASFIPTFILFFSSFLFVSCVYPATEKKIFLWAIYIIVSATLYGLLLIFLNEGNLHQDSFILGKTWSDLWIDTSRGKALNITKILTSAQSLQILVCFILGIWASFQPEFGKARTNLRLFYLSGILAWTIFDILLTIPPIPSFLASIITEVSLLRAINPIIVIFKLITVIILIVLFLNKVSNNSVKWFILSLTVIFVGISTHGIYQHSKNASAGIESDNFKEIVNEINLCCADSIIISDHSLSYVISAFVNVKVYAIMHNRMKFIIGWDEAHKAAEINKDFLNNPISNRNKIPTDKSLLIILDNQKFGSILEKNTEYSKLKILKQNKNFTLLRMKKSSSA